MAALNDVPLFLPPDLICIRDHVCGKKVLLTELRPLAMVGGCKRKHWHLLSVMKDWSHKDPVIRER